MSDNMSDKPDRDQDEGNIADPDDQETVPISPEPPTDAVSDTPELEALDEVERKARDHDIVVERLKRVTADFLNSQKRLERQAEERVAYAVERFAEELLPVADNLARAIESAEEHGPNSGLLEGVSLVKKQMFDVFKNHGIEMISTKVGDRFDSNIHEAVAVIPTDLMEPNHVAEIHHHGFLLRGRLLRAARVVVSAEPSNNEE